MAEASSLDSWKARLQESDKKFYMNLNDLRIQFGLPPVNYHFDFLEDQVSARTIFIKIHNEVYSISYKELNQVFYRFGALDDVVQFNRGHGFHSKICFNSKESTMRAFEFLNGRNIYDDCCTLELFLVQDFVVEPVKAETPPQKQPQELESPPHKQQEEYSRDMEEMQRSNEPRVEIAPDPVVVVEKESPLVAHVLLDEMPMEDGSKILQDNCTVDFTSASGEVFPSSLTPPMVGIEIEVTNCDDLHADSRKMKRDVFGSLIRTAFVEFEYVSFSVHQDSLGIENFNVHPSLIVDHGDPNYFGLLVMKQPFMNAHVMFEKMSEMEVGVGDESIKLLRTLRTVFGSIDTIGFFVFDPGKMTKSSWDSRRLEDLDIIAFDSGG